MSSITIRGCCIGAGRPKVILPIVARTEDDILREARRLSALKADCIEWRADWFSDVLDAAARKRVLSGLRAALGEKLLLVTFRTKAEGGEVSLTRQQYADFCGTVCVSGCADLLDIEFFPNREGLPALIGQAHKAGVTVVCSSHDFHKTPSRTEMVTRLTAMQQAGADLPKLAVMPNSPIRTSRTASSAFLVTAAHGTPVAAVGRGWQTSPRRSAVRPVGCSNRRVAGPLAEAFPIRSR